MQSKFNFNFFEFYIFILFSFFKIHLRILNRDIYHSIETHPECFSITNSINIVVIEEKISSSATDRDGIKIRYIPLLRIGMLLIKLGVCENGEN